MIDLTQAIKVARQAALELLDVRSATVEEIERHKYRGRDVWVITLGFPGAVETAIARLTGNRLEYKRFLVDAETGDFVAMKIREVMTA